MHPPEISPDQRHNPVVLMVQEAWLADSGLNLERSTAIHSELRIRALHESGYMHRYLQVYLWENLYRQVTHVQVPGA